MKLKSGLFVVGGVIACAAAAVIIGTSLTPVEKSFSCNAVVFHSEYADREEFSYLSTQKIIVKPGMMQNAINGQAYSAGKHYILNRTILFSARPEPRSPGSYLLKVTQVRKSGADNVPDVLADKFMSFTADGTERTLHLSRMNNGDLLFTTALGPFFVCDVNGDHK